ncbi:importin-9-like [Thalictrum thalictroides]|uniref:Importin-9-like n=1 Tax=Thalictrum thalictroides TaxID=46969 RepID=A0A7J6VGR3_THATH|nr:importin-9-like [Thalictrum thalictroides]
MENIVDQDQQWLLNCLTATLDTNHEVRSFAEASLSQASLQPDAICYSVFLVETNQTMAIVGFHEGFGCALTKVATVIRNLLLLSLDDPHAKICTAISMAVASIALYDWPEDWAEFLPFLLKLISCQTNMCGVRGAVKCLTLLSDDLNDTSVPILVPVLFPCLYTIISSPQSYDTNLRTKSLSIVHSCISVLGQMSGVFKAETNSLMTSMLKPWAEQFSIILQAPVHIEDPEDWSIRMEVLKCLMQFVQNFPSHIEEEFSVIEAPLWQTFVSSLKVYEISSIRGSNDPYMENYDSDGAEKSLEALVIQLLEFLLTLVGSSRFVKVIVKNVKELVYYTIAFMQITDQQVQTWSLDANQYVADEDDGTYNCRVSGALLLEELVNSCEEGMDAILEATHKRFTESQLDKAAGSTVWWRIREAVIFSLSSVSEALSEISGSPRFSCGNLLEQMLTEDIGTGVHEYPFLHARAFSAVAKFSSLISHRALEQFMYAAIKAISLDVPAPVKVGACQALSQLLPEADKGIVQPHIMDLLSSLMDLLKHASYEALHLILETLQAAVRAGHEGIVTIESIISPMMLNIWAARVSDPFISIDVVEVLEAIKDAPGCIQPLVLRVLPSIGPILGKPQQQPEGVVAGSLDLITMLLKNAPIDIVKAVFSVCFNPVIQIILQTDDHGELQNATECLAAFVSGGKQEMLSWGADSGFTMRSLLDAASRLLDPGLESSGSLFVGSYILQLILHYPLQMAQHIQDLVAALIRRLQSSQTAGLSSSLLLICARLVHMSVPNVEQFIDLLIRLPAEGYENSFAYVMSEWTKQQGEIQGSYQIKVTTSALAMLLSTRHAGLAKIHVQGHLISVSIKCLKLKDKVTILVFTYVETLRTINKDVTTDLIYFTYKSTAGITTRSKGKSAPDQWTVMPLPAKILALLADMLIEIQEQDLDGDDEDSDWEEVQGRDDDTNKDLLYSTGVTSYGRPTVEHLDAIAKVFNENRDDTDEDDLLQRADPLNEINLAKYIADFLVNFSATDRTLLNYLCENLTPDQQNAVQTVLHR